MQKCDVCLPVSPGPGRPSDPEKDRQILAAARSLLFSGGPRALTMDAVAREARVSKATLYARHSNRQALLVAVVCEEAHGIGHALCQRPDNRESMIEDLVSFITALLAFVGSPPHARLLQVMGEVTPDVSDLSALFANGAQNALERLAAYLEAAHRAQHIECDQPVWSAELLIGMAVGLDVVRTLYREPRRHESPDQQAGHARRVVTAFVRMHSTGHVL